MIPILIVFFGFVFGYSYLVRKFKSPFTLTLLFGLKGAGKSTMMVKMMLRDMRKGWKIYTNMSDVNIPGVTVIRSEHLAHYVPPPRSALYIDEAGLVWDNRDHKEFDKGYTEYFKLQRKYKNKVVLNSQALDVDKKIRDLVDRMYLVTNIAGCIGVARPLKRTIKVLEASGNNESRLALNLSFEGLSKISLFLMPRYWRYFDSFRAPVRPDIPGRVIPGELEQRPSLRAQLRLLSANLARRGKKDSQ